MKNFSSCVLLLALAPALSAGQAKPTDLNRALTNGRSAVVFFFAAGCPHNPKGVKDINALKAMLGRQYAVYGMTNLTAKDAEARFKDLGATFRVLGDPTGKRIAEYGARQSLDVIVLGADGKVKFSSRGYHRAALKRLAEALPRPGTNDPKVKLDLEKFPKGLQSGCGIPRG